MHEVERGWTRLNEARGLTRLNDGAWGWTRLNDDVWGWTMLNDDAWGWMRLNDDAWGWTRLNDAVADPGGVRGVKSNPPLAHSLVWKIPIWTFTFAQKYLSGNVRTPPRTPLHRILDPPQWWCMRLNEVKRGWMKVNEVERWRTSLIETERWWKRLIEAERWWTAGLNKAERWWTRLNDEERG